MVKVLPKLLLAALLAGTGLVITSRADDRQDDQNRNADNDQPRFAYLGVGLEPLHPALGSHLGSTLGEGRGVLVNEVAPGSPADRAGIRAHDILVSVDDQRIYSAEQLAKLIHHDQPGHEVTLGIVRGGKTRDLRVKLGERPNNPPQPSHAPQLSHAPQPPRFPMNEQRFRQQDEEQQAGQWRMFDSMTLARLGKDRFKAEIKYRDDQGKIETQKFEGTRSELRNDINNERNLPSEERAHLLRALDLPDHSMGFNFPGFGFDPSGGLFFDFD